MPLPSSSGLHRLRRLSRLGALLLLALAASARATPVSPAALQDGRLALTPFVEVVEDPSGTLTVEQVASGAYAAWKADTELRLNRGFSRNTFWVHFSLAPDMGGAGGWLLEAWRTVDAVELYTELPGGSFRRQRTGKLLALSERDVEDARLLLDLTVPPESTGRYWLRMSSGNSLVLTPVLWTREAHARRNLEEGLLFGTHYGLLLAMLVYNLFLFLSIRDGTYGAYVVFQLGTLLMLAAGDQLTFRYLWPEHPRWAIRVELLFIGLMMFGAVDFTRRFLGLPSGVARMDRVLRGLMWGTVLFMAAAALTASSAVMQLGALLAVACSLAILASGLLAWRAGNPNALIFLVAWLVMLSGATLTVLTLLGLLPSNPWTVNGPRLGSGVEAMLLSLGLARRIKLLRQENARARAELLDSRLQYARTLEARVEERTRELTEALAELRATQARMVRQARLASLGHLVAGVAHEVGNPLNFTIGGATDLEQRLQALRAELGKPPHPERVGKLLHGAERALKLVRDGNTRIRQIVDNLRAYTRSRDAVEEAVDPLAELETTLGLIQSRLDERGIRVERRLEPLPRVMCRPGELGQVFMNLLLNSCQAMPDGGELVLSSRCGDGRVELTFQDTGPGVAPEHREAIFDPFFTTRPPNEGTGLGLSISHEIVTRHGGELRLAESERGARFVLTLPVSAATRLGA
jgi:signal transduction histidine kinase